MKDYLKIFSDLVQYNAWKESSNFIAPNVSLNDSNDTIIYNKLIIITPSVTMNDWQYGNIPSDPIVSGNTGNGMVTYEYKISTADDSTYTLTKPSDAGTYMVKASIAANGPYNASYCISTFTITKANIYPTITMTDWTYGETASNPSVSNNTGNGDVTYKYKVSTADDSTYTLTKPSDAGTYTVKATINATTNYNGAICTTTFTINKVTPNVVSPVPNVLTYNKSAQELATIGSTNFGTLKYSLDNSNWSTSMPTATNGGTYTLYYKVDGDSNINNITSNSITCSIAEKRVSNPTIILSQDVYTYNGSSCTPTPTVKDGNDVIDSAEYTISYLNNTNAGTASVVISDIVDGNYYIEGVQTFTINKAAGSVSTAPIANSLTYDGTAQTVATAGTGTGTMMYRLGDSGDYSSTMPTATNAGSYTLYYYAAESTNYNATTPASISININESVTPSHNYANDYLTIESLQDNNTIGWRANSSSLKSISISTDGGTTWTNKESSTSGTSLATLNTGDKLLVKGSNTAHETSSYYNYFTSTGNFNVEGNIMSLIYGDDFIGQTTLDSSENKFIFHNIFYNCSKLISAENLILSATTLSGGCYQYMFSGCTSLTTAPELPATTLASNCYAFMFNGCRSLTTVPKSLPATTLANGCYSSMFSGCTSLTTAPALLATTLAESCYHQMFYDCTALTTAPELPATTLASYCYNGMFYGCTSLTTAPELPATTLAPYCYQSMFQGCTSLTTAPELPATTLASYCYITMFNGCTSLITTPELPATILTTGCYIRMFQGCTSLTAASELPATTLAEQCYAFMFNGCTSLTTVPKILPATTLAQDCYQYMFYVCTALTTAPDLPATTLVQECYSNMFYGCTSLNYIKCLATDISATYSTNNWVNGVASTGIFVKNDSMSSWKTGIIGIPSGWTQINNGDLPITWNNNEVYLVNSSNKPTLINPFNLPITYSSSDTNVATIDNSGNVTFVSAGTVTLTAVFAGNETYQAKTTTCTFNTMLGVTLCTLYDSNNNILANITSDNSTLSSSLISSYKSSTYKVIISSDCTSIGTDAFKQFTNLRSITKSSNVSTIGNNAFYSCSSLKEIICNRTTAPSLGNYNVFYSVARGGVLITPSGSSGYNTWMSTSFYYLGYYQWYNAVGTFGDTEPTLQWSSSSYTITSSYFSTPTLSKQSGITVTYRSSNTSVATINSSGTVSKGSNGTTYIQAIFAGNSTYKPKVATYTLTVNVYSGGSSGGGGGGE